MYTIGQDTSKVLTQSDTLITIGTVVEKAFIYQELYQTTQLQYLLQKQDIIKLREQKGFTQESIASELNIFQESYARWESGAIKYPRMKTLQQLADTLGTTIEYLTDSEILPIFQKLDEQDKKLTVSFAENLLNKKDDK